VSDPAPSPSGGPPSASAGPAGGVGGGERPRPAPGRKPPGVSWESWADRQIREAMARGELDDLPGSGQPLPDLDQPHDDLWWVRKKLEREQLAYLPPALALRKEWDDLIHGLPDEASESALRAKLSDLNERIRRLNRLGAPGPPSTLVPADVETVMTRWRLARRRRSDVRPGQRGAPSGLEAEGGDGPTPAGPAADAAAGGPPTGVGSQAGRAEGRWPLRWHRWKRARQGRVANG
jgi:hypothetical protein